MQDLLDIDIRSEVATVVGGVNEFTSLMSDLPSLDIDTCSNDGELAWFGGPKWSATNDIYADVGACINPNSVHSSAPVTTTTQQASVLASPKAQLNLNTNQFQAANSPLPSPKEKKSHLTFSPNTIKVPIVQENKKQSSLLCQAQRASIDTIKKDLNDDMKDERIIKQLTHGINGGNNNIHHHHHNQSNTTTTSTATGGGGTTNTIKLAAGIGGLTFANSLMYAKLKQNSNNKILSNVTSSTNKHTNSQLSANTIMTSNSSQIMNNSPQQKIFSRSIIVQNNKAITSQQHILPTTASATTTHSGLSQQMAINKQIKSKATEDEFPKPPCSYSCLIAMALKNSRAGSLPVSEIYSFMCEHFPYFKTAPNIWKNSVRHNLSMNKCFEKIEKPATNGGQRKGCLWAMNPSKVIKMDDEIQKWSRKDPVAISKAMVYPDNLPMLERGEMKHGSAGDSEGENDGADEDTEDNSDSEHEADVLDETVINATEPESCEEDEPNSQTDYEIEVILVHLHNKTYQQNYINIETTV